MFQVNRKRWVVACAWVVTVANVTGCTVQSINKVNMVTAPKPPVEAEVTPKVVDQVLPKPIGSIEPTDPNAQYRLALDLLDAGTDASAATQWLERAAMQGHGDAAFRLGELQDEPSRQVEWYSMAAAAGQVDAQYALGDAYLNGRGTAKEPAWGLTWLERAARAGQAKAQFSMGIALAFGLTGAPQRQDALVWLLIAQKNNFAHAGAVMSALKARLTKTMIKQSQERADAWTNEPAGDAENRALVRFAQYALGRVGFDAGLADGIRGDRTNAAVQAFRKAQNLGKGGLSGRMVDILRERLAVFNRS